MRVDLSNFFSDARRNTLIFIDESWVNIKDVQDHIQNLFRLSNISLLTQDGCYLPPKESIKVLSYVDSLKAFKLSEEELKDLSSGRLSIAECSKKRKNRSTDIELEFSSSTPHNPKRSRCKNDAKEQSTLKADIPNDGCLTRRSSHRSLASTTAVDEEPEPTQLKEAENMELSEELEVTEVGVISNRSQAPSESSRRVTGTNVRAANKSKSHIIFQEAETAQIKTVEPTNVMPDVEFRSPVTELDNKSVRHFKLPRKNHSFQILEEIVIPAPVKSPQKNGRSAAEPLEAQVATNDSATEAEVPSSAKKLVSVEAQVTTEDDATEEELPSSAKKQVSVEESYEEEQEVLEEQTNLKTQSTIAEQSVLDSSSEDDVMVLDDTNADDSNSAEVIADMLKNAVRLTTVPNVGDVIFFKLTKTKGASQLSAKTEDIAGTCSYINRRTKALTVSLIAFPSTSRRVLQQYSNCLDDSSDGSMVLSVNFRDLIDPRVVVASVD